MEKASIGQRHAQWHDGGVGAAELGAVTVLFTETGTMSTTRVDVPPADCTYIVCAGALFETRTLEVAAQVSVDVIVT